MFVLFLILLVSIACAALAVPYSWNCETPARLQWLHNDGYCGEVSLIMAGLKYGQYLSQYDARDVATGSQQKYYLVGSNDQETSTKLGLGSIEFDSRSNIGAENYLAWVKKMTRQGYAVTITVYMNYYLFYGITNSDAGEYDYDHIVSVSKIESQYDDDLYHATDVITMEDHGLWAPRTTGPVYFFNYTFADFIGTREEANEPKGSVYTLPYSSHLTCFNFGIAHTGVIDTNRDTNRVVVRTSVNYEDPEIKNRSDERPAAMPLDLTITVEDLVNGVNYNLYRYNEEIAVPTSNFNKNSVLAQKTVFTCCSSSDNGQFKENSFVMSQSIMSNEKAIYRAVRSDAL
jgi:hypothetical protein